MTTEMEEFKTRIFVFQLVLDGRVHGNYGAFDYTEDEAKTRVESFFKGINPHYTLEARLIEVLSNEAKSKDFLNSIGIPVFDRRKMRRQ